MPKMVVDALSVEGQTVVHKGKRLTILYTTPDGKNAAVDLTSGSPHRVPSILGFSTGVKC